MKFGTIVLLAGNSNAVIFKFLQSVITTCRKREVSGRGEGAEGRNTSDTYCRVVKRRKVTGLRNFCSGSIFVESTTISTQNVPLASGFIAIANNLCGISYGNGR